MQKLPLSYNNALVHAGKPVALWLTGCAAIVGGVVCVGGLTRLTRSGTNLAETYKFAWPVESNVFHPASTS